MDDQQIAIARQFEPHWLEELHSLAPGLAIHVDEREMITPEQLTEIEAFLRDHSPSF